MLLYSVLHLAELSERGRNHEILDAPAVPLDEIKRFRQLGSLCPGHPESYLTTEWKPRRGRSVRASRTASGWRSPADGSQSRYNQPGFEDLYNFKCVRAGRRWLHDGGNFERSRLARRPPETFESLLDLRQQPITIEAVRPLAFSEDVGARFAAYGWNVTHVTDANDLDILRGFRTFLQTGDRPTLIVVNSHIGWGSPHKQDSTPRTASRSARRNSVLTKTHYGGRDAKFLVAERRYEHFQSGHLESEGNPSRCGCSLQ